MAGMTQLGKGMMIAGCLLFIGLMTLWFGEVERDRDFPNRSPTSTIEGDARAVYLKQGRQGHYTVTGYIDREPILFLVDTGATDVVIPEGVARRLNLQPGRARRANTANGVITVYETEIKTLEIASLTFNNVRGSINPGMRGEAALLGMSVLRQVELEQSQGTLILRKRQ